MYISIMSSIQNSNHKTLILMCVSVFERKRGRFSALPPEGVKWFHEQVEFRRKQKSCTRAPRKWATCSDHLARTLKGQPSAKTGFIEMERNIINIETCPGAVVAPLVGSYMCKCHPRGLVHSELMLLSE